MAHHVTRAGNKRRAKAGIPGLHIITMTAAASATLGLLLMGLSWLAPAGSAHPVEHTAPSLEFDYYADVPRSPAYDDDRVTAPDPVFRRLADEVIVRYTYLGEPGTVGVAAELSTASGWRSRFALKPAATFDSARHAGSVLLDLGSLEKRAAAAADVIGIPATQVDVAVILTVTVKGRPKFAPRLAFTLDPTQLSLVGGRDALIVQDALPAPQPAVGRDTVALGGYQVATSTLRTAGLILILVALLLLGPIALARARIGSDETAAIQRRYASLLLPVAPMTTPSGRPLVDVTDFPTLARLAERYGLMVMHWTRSDVDTYLVHDDGITYRYRTGSSHEDIGIGVGGLDGRSVRTRGTIT
ncbi:MAG: hypothetical protein WB767_12590 [Nocardioides sp.]